MSVDFTTDSGIGVLLPVSSLHVLGLSGNLDPYEVPAAFAELHGNAVQVEVFPSNHDEAHFALIVPGTYNSHMHKDESGVLQNVALPSEETLIKFLDKLTELEIPDQPMLFTVVSTL